MASYINNRLILPTDLKIQKELTQEFDWSRYLKKTNSVAASVSAFQHAPMSDIWHKAAPGCLVEVENLDSPKPGKYYWIATIEKMSGYKVLLRYLGYEDGRFDFWCNLGNFKIHHIGWCGDHGKKLTPPLSMKKNPEETWNRFIYDRAMGRRTIHKNFFANIKQSLRSSIKVGTFLEVVDKTCLCQNRIGKVIKNISGRLCISYEDLVDEENNLFWCHETAPIIYPIGFSQKHGRLLKTGDASRDISRYNKVADDLFKQNFPQPQNANGFKEGMKLEAVDPIKTSIIRVATVAKILKSGYIMISVDRGEDTDENNKYCLHRTSSLIFPINFCKSNNIKLTPPEEDDEDFDWSEYLKVTNSIPVPSHLFEKHQQSINFAVGMKLEAVDLQLPNFIGVATVKNVIGRLLLIGFDGWDSTFDQWMDESSTDLFPVGWCELVGHQLLPPKAGKKPSEAPPKKVSRSSAGGSRKRRGRPKKRSMPRDSYEFN